MLLIAYAVELILKAGLTSLYRGCSKELFSHDVKKRFGHSLKSIAKEIEFPTSASHSKQLRQLQNIVLSEGRYPFLSDDPKHDMARRNKRSHYFWDDTQFKAHTRLYDAIRHHVALLDQDSHNPATFVSVGIDKDGYFSFRRGGNLSSRIIVKYSSLQRRQRRNNPRQLRSLLLSHLSNPFLKHDWDAARFRCVQM
ncbi:MAG: hypothetical protein R3F29_04615 [Planctomycetota bacterium]